LPIRQFKLNRKVAGLGLIIWSFGAGHARDYRNDRGHGPLLQADTLMGEKMIMPYDDFMHH